MERVENEMDRVESYIDRIPSDKSFGFIRGLGKDPDYFFHKTDYLGYFNGLREELYRAKKEKRQIRVSFILQQTEQGMRAIEIRRID